MSIFDKIINKKIKELSSEEIDMAIKELKEGMKNSTDEVERQQYISKIELFKNIKTNNNSRGGRYQ